MHAVPTAAPSMPREACVRVDGLRLRFLDVGDGPPVLLLHGLGRSLEDWTEQVERLSGAHRLIVPDLPGFGRSDALRDDPDLHSYADLLAGLLDVLGVDAAHVAGNSFGGAAAMALAARHPDRAGALVLADPAGFGREVTIGLRMLAVRPLGALLLRPHRATSRRAVRGLFADPALATAERAALAYRLACRPDRRAVMIAVGGALGDLHGVRPEWRERLLAELAAAGTPVSVVWGDADRVLPCRHLAAVRQALPTAETHLFPGTGHMPHIERPDAFAAVLLDFLARHPLPAVVDQDHRPDPGRDAAPSPGSAHAC